MKSLTINVQQSLKYILLFLLGVNFGNKFYYIVPLFIIIVLLQDGKTLVSRRIFKRFIMLLIFTVIYLYGIFRSNGTNLTKIIVYMSFPFMYLVGYFFKIRCEQWKASVLTLIAGLAIHGVLNLATNSAILLGGFGTRSTIDFWTKSEWIMTGQISLFILISGCAYYIFFSMSKQENAILKPMLIVLLVLGLIYNVLGATRTVVYACVLDMIICIFISLWKKRKNAIKLFKYTLGIALVIFCLWGMYALNIFNVRTIMESTPLFQRIERLNTVSTSTNERQEQVYLALMQLFDYPLGGYKMNFPGMGKIDFIHNTWLNIAYATGYIPCIVFLLFCLWGVKDCITILKKDTENNAVFVCGIFIVALVYMYLEPVCEAVPSFITIFCFICGRISYRVEEINDKCCDIA